jgi:hypothetical protein
MTIIYSLDTVCAFDSIIIVMSIENAIAACILSFIRVTGRSMDTVRSCRLYVSLNDNFSGTADLIDSIVYV